jgi:hypothetical protein
MNVSLLLTATVSHGSIPRDFLISNIIPIPKNKHVNASDSNSFRGIALSSIFGKILENIIFFNPSMGVGSKMTPGGTFVACYGDENKFCVVSCYENYATGCPYVSHYRV